MAVPEGKTTCPTLPLSTSVWQYANVEKLCKTLIVSPTAMVTPHLPVNILMSRRIPRLVEKYAKLSMDDRDKIEILIDQMLGIEPQEIE